jgi:hypothetical protein
VKRDFLDKKFLSGGLGHPLRMPSASCHEPYKRLWSGAPNILSICASNAPEAIVTLRRRPTDKGRRLTDTTIDRSRITQPG